MLQLSSSLEENLAALNARFGASADFYAKRIELYHCPGAIVLFDNMASLESLWSLLLDAATRLLVIFPAPPPPSHAQPRAGADASQRYAGV